MENGIQSQLSRYPVAETVSRLESLIKERGLKVFCVIDHAAEARASGLTMPETRVLIFGAGKAGTPLMIATPSLALDLPLRILIAETPDGKAKLSWNDPAWLQQRYGFPESLLPNISGVAKLVSFAAA